MHGSMQSQILTERTLVKVSKSFEFSVVDAKDSAHRSEKATWSENFVRFCMNTNIQD